ncbi:porphobilinogen deaminase isoform X2 [Toxorhynchites rutilus septentrionalis]|nr:porphobilinogen deaminase isoform X2 [Toxorhynchites rutilus septentrionalis]
MYPDVQYEIHTMTTVGDRVLNKSLPKIGEKSLFTKDLEDALRTGGVDFVVHSLKDLPTALPVGMAIGAVLEREDPRDALVLNAKHRGKSLSTLPQDAIIGTSSLRRSAQLARNYPHLKVCDIRGNLNTRLAKLDAESSKFAGIILAQAGLMRMGWSQRIDHTIEPSDILYAVGQGALAVECRSNDEYILDMLSKLCHIETQCRIVAERSLLKTLGGGCSAPVAVCTNMKRKHDSGSTQLNIQGAVWSLDGKTEIRAEDGCCFQLRDTTQQDVDNGNVILAKKSKVEENDESVSVDSPTTDKRKSPEIIDESKPGCSQASDEIDFVKLITTHEEVFKKCPYSTKFMQSNEVNESQEKGQGDAKSPVCPSSSFPVGIDFMGDCPYVSTEQKVDQSEQPILKCPVSGLLQADEKNPAAQDALNKQITEKCPFLAQQAKVLDYNENLQRDIVAPKLEDHSEQLFCGMFRHGCVEKEIFDECERLGQRLAQALISKGALDVMKCAQNEIHSKV